MREKKCCVNCGIANVPLYLGLDGHLHCADHAGMLIPEQQKPEQPKKEEQEHGTDQK